MYRQFALVIAATALISAINAATLKPTQCALWLRQPDRSRRKNIFFRAFNVRLWARRKSFMCARFAGWCRRSGLMVVIGLLLIGLAGWGLTRIPTSFIPTEDQGYAMVTVQLPDSASLERTEAVMDRLTKICQEHPAVERTIAIGGLSPLDANASFANAGIVYLMLKDWSKRPKGEDLRSIYNGLSARLANFQDAKTMVIVPPPIQGLGLSGGFQMQVELTDGSFDLPRLQAVAEEIVAQAKVQSGDPDGADAAARLCSADLDQCKPNSGRNARRRRRRYLPNNAELSWLKLCESIHQIWP